MRRLKIKEYSQLKNISIPTIYKQIDKGLIKVYKEGRSVFIEVEDNSLELEKTIKNDSTELMSEKIKYLEEMLKKEVEARERAEQREKEAIERSELDKQSFNERLKEANHLIAKGQQNINILSENIKALEHKAETIEEELINEKSKTWWQKLFNKK